MFFRNLLCTVTLATLASAAVAKQIPTSYNNGESETTTEEVFEREAEPEPARTAVWEQAHGGPAPTYKFGEEHDAGAWHIARDANPMAEAEAEAEPGWANVGGNRQKKPGNHFACDANHMADAEPEAEPGWANVGGNRQQKPGNHFAREANPMAETEAEPGWANVGGNRQHRPVSWVSSLSETVKNAIPTDRPFLKGGPSKFEGKFKPTRETDDDEEVEGLFTRDPGPEDLEIPDFGDEEVDTSLEGLLTRRDVEGDDDDDDDDDDEEPQGLFTRDPSPEDLEIPDFGDDEVDTSLEGLLVRRDAESDDDEADSDADEPYDESQADLSGYDAGILQRRSDGTADEIDYSLEGYEEETFEIDEEEKAVRLIQARDYEEDEVAADDEYLHSDEHREFLASHGVTERSFEDDIQDAEHDRIDARDVNEPVPDFGDEEVDTSLEGMYLGTRDTDDEEDDSEDSYDADAAYADAEVVQEFVAPKPGLE